MVGLVVTLAPLGTAYGFSIIGERESVDAVSSLAVAVGSAVIGVILLAIGESFFNAGPLLTAGGVAATLVLLGVVMTAAPRRTGP